jgi:hypothetical protein
MAGRRQRPVLRIDGVDRDVVVATAGHEEEVAVRVDLNLGGRSSNSGPQALPRLQPGVANRAAGASPASVIEWATRRSDRAHISDNDPLIA